MKFLSAFLDWLFPSRMKVEQDRWAKLPPPSAILTCEGKLFPEQIEKLKAEWYNHYVGK
jgi:hypothetical protein